MKVKVEKSKLTIFAGSTPFIRVDLDILNDVQGYPLNEIDIIEIEKKKRKTQKEKIDPKRLKKAIQLAKRWAKMKKVFHKQKVLRVPSQTGNDFKHFLKAVDIINDNETTIKKFLNAQIEGLKFTKEGRGIFPKPNHLSTLAAESRLLDFIRDKELENVELTEIEKSTPLQRNELYKKRYQKIKDKKATLFEALYVQECQFTRKDAAQEFVLDYVSNLRKK